MTPRYPSLLAASLLAAAVLCGSASVAGAALRATPRYLRPAASVRTAPSRARLQRLNQKLAREVRQSELDAARDARWNAQRPHELVKILGRLTAARRPGGSLGPWHTVVKALTRTVELRAKQLGVPADTILLSVADFGSTGGSNQNLLVLDGGGRFLVYERASNTLRPPAVEDFEGNIWPLRTDGDRWALSKKQGGINLRFSTHHVLRNIDWLARNLHRPLALDDFVWNPRLDRPKDGPAEELRR